MAGVQPCRLQTLSASPRSGVLHVCTATLVLNTGKFLGPQTSRLFKFNNCVSWFSGHRESLLAFNYAGCLLTLMTHAGILR